MKLKFSAIILALSILLASCATTEHEVESDDIYLSASFYPVYIALLNVTDGMDNVYVNNITANSGGCLHDYAIGTKEVKAAANCNIFFISGAGMEPFMERLERSLDPLVVFDTSWSITLSEDGNPHYWTSIENHMIQVRDIAECLSGSFPERADEFSSNCATYLAKLEELKNRLETELAPYAGSKLITFHEAFDYFADEFDLEVAATIVHDEHTAPSPRDIEQTIEIIKSNNIRAIFAEPGNHDSAIDTIADATGAEVFTLDPVTTGEDDKDAYIDAMEKNLKTLKDALKG